MEQFCFQRAQKRRHDTWSYGAISRITISDCAQAEETLEAALGRLVQEHQEVPSFVVFLNQ